LGTLLVVLIVLLLAACTIGSEHIALSDVARTVGAKLFGSQNEVSRENSIIILAIRLPRVLLAIVVGAALSSAGAAYQALLRNPLADPYILGVSTGAAVGAITATLVVGSSPLIRPAGGFRVAPVTMPGV